MANPVVDVFDHVADPFVDALKRLQDFQWGEFAKAVFERKDGRLRLEIEWVDSDPSGNDAIDAADSRPLGAVHSPSQPKGEQ